MGLKRLPPLRYDPLPPLYLSFMNMPDLAGRLVSAASPGPGGSHPGTCAGPKLKSCA